MKRLLAVCFWGVLVLAVTGYSQWEVEVEISGYTCRVIFDFANPQMPIKTEATGNVKVVFYSAHSGVVLAETTSFRSGYYRVRFRVGIAREVWIFAVCSRRDLRPTASFAFRVHGNMTDVVLPIIDPTNYRALVAFCGISQDPLKSIILALYHPTGQWPDGTPGSLHRGVAMDSFDTAVPWTLIHFPVVPPGDRRWIGIKAMLPPPLSIQCVPNYREPGFRPLMTVIFNADRLPPVPGNPVRAYRFLFAVRWPNWEQLGVVPGYAPTPVDITIGIVRSS